MPNFFLLFACFFLAPGLSGVAFVEVSMESQTGRGCWGFSVCVYVLWLLKEPCIYAKWSVLRRICKRPRQFDIFIAFLTGRPAGAHKCILFGIKFKKV